VKENGRKILPFAQYFVSKQKIVCMDPLIRTGQDKDIILQKMNRFKVVELQQVLGMLKLSKAGRKAELFDRLKSAFINSPQNLQVVKNAVEMVSAKSMQSYSSPYGMPSYTMPRPDVNLFNTPTPFLNSVNHGFMPANRPALPAPVIPSTPIQIPPQLSFEDLKPIATYAVGASGLKPPVIFKLRFDKSDLEKLQSVDPITNTRNHRLLLYSCQTNPPLLPPGKLAFPDGLSISCNGVYAHVNI
jgi:hypothetical protein